MLLLTVVLLPVLLVNDVRMGDPYFCKYLCRRECSKARFRSPSSIVAYAPHWERCSPGSSSF